MSESSYVICATPRSGSTLLCGLLAQTGVLGHPDSFYRTVSAEWWSEHWELDASADGSPDFERCFLAAALREGRGDGAIFGMRLMYENLQDFVARLCKVHGDKGDEITQIKHALGPTRFIHLSRSNKLEQAISWVKARQSGLWHQTPDGQEIERLSPPAEPEFDAQQIGIALAMFKSQDAAWEQWFKAHNVTPIRIGYEELARDPAGYTGRVLNALGLDCKLGAGVRAHVRKLADETSADWVRKFNEQAGA